jgi:hypothetical protein
VSLCVIAAGKAASTAASAFTLSWTHSVEKTAWEEDWLAGADGLRIVEARIKGSGAGMEPPDGAVLENGWWVYAPDLAPLSRLVLAASGATPSGWTLCAGTECLTLGSEPGDTVVIEPCRR